MRFVPCLPGILCLVLHAARACAAWPNDPNVNVPICAVPGSQATPMVAPDILGGAIVVWGDARNSTLYAQRVDASGTTLWTDGGVMLCNAPSYKVAPQIVADGFGGAIVAWFDQRTGFDMDIYAQRVDPNGALLWVPAGAPVCATPGPQTYPTLIPDGSGGAIITWFDLRDGLHYHIYAQRMNSYSVPLWTANGSAVCMAADNQASPTIASDGAGGAIITWIDHRNGNDDIYAQRLDPSGTARWATNGVPICTAGGDQQYPRIVSDGAGGAIITWQDHRKTTDFDIYAQRIDSTGAVQWAANGVAICDADGDQNIPEIASDDAGGAIVTWGDLRSGTDFTDYVQRITAAGLPAWAHNGVGVCSVVCGKQEGAQAIASDGAGGAIVTWGDARSGASDIYAQRFDATGAYQWDPGGVALCTAIRYQFEPAVISDAAGGAIVAWTDGRRDTTGDPERTDIYAQRVGAGGALGGVPLAVTEPSVAFALDVPRPCPARSATTIEFRLPRDMDVTLRLFDASGRRVRTLAQTSYPPGVHALLWDLRDDAGRAVKEGLYFARLVTLNGIRVQRVVVLR